MKAIIFKKFFSLCWFEGRAVLSTGSISYWFEYLNMNIEFEWKIEENGDHRIEQKRVPIRKCILAWHQLIIVIFNTVGTARACVGTVRQCPPSTRYTTHVCISTLYNIHTSEYRKWTDTNLSFDTLEATWKRPEAKNEWERERKRDKGRLKIVPFMKNSSHTTIALWITNIEYRWNEAYFTVTVKLTHKTIEQNYYNRHSVIFMVFRSSSFVGHRTIAANISSTICSGSISFHFFLSAFCVWFRL